MTPELYAHLSEHARWPFFPTREEHLRFLTLALAGECGELAEHAYSFKAADLREMAKELADVGNYTWMIAGLFSMNLRPEVVATPFRAKCDRQLWLICKINREAGKLANLVKKDWRGDDGAPVRQREMLLHLSNLADWLWTLAAVDGVKLYDAMLAKMREVEQRPAWKAGLAAQDAAMRAWEEAHQCSHPARRATLAIPTDEMNDRVLAGLARDEQATPMGPNGYTGTLAPAPECTCVGVCLEAMIAGPHPRHLACRMDAKATPQDPSGDGSFRGPDGAR